MHENKRKEKTEVIKPNNRKKVRKEKNDTFMKNILEKKITSEITYIIRS